MSSPDASIGERGPGLRASAHAAARLLSASVLAQGAVFIALLVAATWFHPSDFALFGVTFGLAGIINSGNTFAVETRLTVVGDNGVSGLVRVGGTTASGMLLIGLSVAGAFAVFAGPGLAISVALAVGAGYLMAWQQVLTAIALRRSSPRALSASRTAQGLTNAALIVVLGTTSLPGYVALGGAWAVSLLVGVLLLATVVPPSTRRFQLAKRRDWVSALQQVRFQPVSNLLVAVAAQAPLVLLPAIASDSTAGAWALCTRLLSAGVTTGYAVLQPIYYAEAAKLVRALSWEQLRRWHGRWATGLAIGACLLMGVGGWLMVTLLPRLDPQWSGVETVVIAGCIYWGSLFWSVPISQTLQLIHAMGFQLAWSAARFVVAGGGFIVTSPIGGQEALVVWAVLCLLTDVALVAIHRRLLTHRAHPRTHLPRTETHPDLAK